MKIHNNYLNLQIHLQLPDCKHELAVVPERRRSYAEKSASAADFYFDNAVLASELNHLHPANRNAQYIASFELLFAQPVSEYYKVAAYND